MMVPMRLSGIVERAGVLPRWVLAAVVVQVAVPGIVLVASEPPSRFGFQMYSGMGSATVEARTSDGRLVELPDDLLAGMMRPDVPWLSRLPEHVCERVPQAARVTVEQNGERREVTC